MHTSHKVNFCLEVCTRYCIIITRLNLHIKHAMGFTFCKGYTFFLWHIVCKYVRRMQGKNPDGSYNPKMHNIYLETPIPVLLICQIFTCSGPQ